MKTSFTLIAALSLCIGVFSCSKSSQGDKEPEPTGQFEITGLRDIDFSFDSSSLSLNSITFQVASNAGKPDSIALSLQGVPAGLLATMRTDIGVPPFTSTIDLKLSGTVGSGVYPITLTGRSPQGETRYNFTLRVAPSTYGLELFPDTVLLSKYAFFGASLPKLSVGGIVKPTLTVSNLPQQLTCKILSRRQYPDSSYSDVIEIHEDGIVPEGYYSANVTVRSGTFSVTKQKVIHIGRWGGYITNGQRFRSFIESEKWDVTWALHFVNRHERTAYPDIWIKLHNGNLPKSDGTYTYKIGGSSTETHVSIEQRYYLNTTHYELCRNVSGAGVLTATRSGGRWSLTSADIVMEDPKFGNKRTLVIDSYEP